MFNVEQKRPFSTKSIPLGISVENVGKFGSDLQLCWSSTYLSFHTIDHARVSIAERGQPKRNVNLISEWNVKFDFDL